MRRIFLITSALILFLGVFLTRAPAAYAADVTFNADTILSGNWDSFATVTAKSGCNATTLDVQSGKIVITVASGDSCALETSAGTFTTTGSDTTACGPPIRLTVNGAATNVEITPANSTCVPTSGGVSVVTSPAPQTPVNIQAAYSSSPAPSGAITLTWKDPPAHASKIEVWRNEGGVSPITGPRGIVAIGAQKYLDTEQITPGVTYIYQLIAVGSGGKGISQEVPGVAIAGTVSVAPSTVAPPAAELKPELKVTLSAQAVGSAGVAAVSAVPLSGAVSTVLFALAFSALLTGAFLLHSHVDPHRSPLQFASIFPMLFASPAYSFERLARRTPAGKYERSYSKHKRLLKASRISLLSTFVAAAVKLLLVLVVFTAFVPDSRLLLAQEVKVKPGEQVTVLAKVENTGAAKATNVVLTIPTPAQTSYVENSAVVNGKSSARVPEQGTLTIPWAELPVNSSHEVRMKYKVESGALKAGVVTISAQATAAEVSGRVFTSNTLTFPVVAASPVLPTPKVPLAAVKEAAPKAAEIPAPALERAPEPVPPSLPPVTPATPKEAVIPLPAGDQTIAPVIPPGAEVELVIPPAVEISPVTPIAARGSSVQAFPNPALLALPPPQPASAFVPSAVTVTVDFNASILDLINSAGALAGVVPVRMRISAPVPEGTTAAELVIQSAPQIIPCAVQGGVADCNAQTNLEPGPHTIFAQAYTPEGLVRISSVTQFMAALPACFDGADNDHDGLTDYPDDPGCASKVDTNESESAIAALAPLLPEPAAKAVVQAVAAVSRSATYQVLDKQIINNPTVEKITVTVAAPVVVAAAAANTGAAVASTAVSFTSLLTYLQGFITQPLLLFTRRRRKSWGLVYSSLTKLPVDLALVRLFEHTPAGVKGRLLQTRVTDKAGRYVLIASPGSYTVEVTKPGFNFPSKFLLGKTADLDYMDLYLGGPLELAGGQTTLTRPIPVDPLEKTETPKDVIARQRKRNLQKTVAYSGPFLAMAAVVITPSLTTGLLLLAQLGMLGLFKRLAIAKPPPSWGVVKDARSGQPIPYAVTRIFDTQFNKLLETQITDSNGRYAFLVGRGSFYITIERPGYRPYRSATLDLTSARAKEIIRQEVRLEPGAPEAQRTPEAVGITPSSAMISAPESAPPPALEPAPEPALPPASEPAPSPLAIGTPTVQNPSQADQPAALTTPPGKGNGKGNGNGNGQGNARNGNGKNKKMNGIARA
ncbi:carboxypeptidase regulatory-like domain-containing protein [Candidatus Uhrbacteria bacterium]|nr:carboxypeptidase regulatory-like domain-containing protein [Candidatus Uhrbacteria bacterium]